MTGRVAPTRRRGGNSSGVDARRRRRQDTQRTSRSPRRRGARQRRRLGSSRIALREERAWTQAGFTEVSPVSPTDGRAAMRVASPAEPPGATRQRVRGRPGRFACFVASDRGNDTGFATCDGGISTTGGACASTARWRRGWTCRGGHPHFPDCERPRETAAASTPRDRARMEGGQSRPRSSRGPSRGTRVHNPLSRTGWSGAERPCRSPRNRQDQEGRRTVPSCRHCTGEATTGGTHPAGSVGGP